MADKILLNSKLTRPPFARSKVDIIIPFHGCYDKVARLVQSILTRCRSNPYQICLVDDGSPNSDFITQMKDVPQVFCVSNQGNLGFGSALAAGFAATKQPWVMFMHSDTVVEDGNWMIQMGETLLALKDKGVKMVSAMTNNAAGGDESIVRQQLEVKGNVILDKNGVLPLICTMCHRELFQNIGGFVKPYPYAYYEDEELAYRMSKRGYKQAVCGKSWIYHEGGCTIKELLSQTPDKRKPNIKAVMESNREKCMADMKKYR